MEFKNMKLLLLALVIGACTPQILPMDAEEDAPMPAIVGQRPRTFDLLRCEFDRATTPKRKAEVLHGMLINAGVRSVDQIGHPENAANGRVVLNDLQTLERLTADYRGIERIQNDMTHFAAGRTFADVVALFQPHEDVGGAQIEVARQEPVHGIAERFDVVDENPDMEGAPVLEAHANAAPQPQRWWQTSKRSWWWIVVPVAVVIVALLCRGKKSSAPMPRPHRNPNH